MDDEHKELLDELRAKRLAMAKELGISEETVRDFDRKLAKIEAPSFSRADLNVLFNNPDPDSPKAIIQTIKAVSFIQTRLVRILDELGEDKLGDDLTVDQVEMATLLSVGLLFRGLKRPIDTFISAAGRVGALLEGYMTDIETALKKE